MKKKKSGFKEKTFDEEEEFDLKRRVYEEEK